jgi:hypothetical protein
MKREFDKKKITNVLFGVAVFILTANLVTGKLLKGRINSEKDELKSSEIELHFKSALSNLGIKEGLLQRQQGDGSPVKFSVQVPKDLPVVEILQEMNYVFNPTEIEIRTVENKIGGKTSVDFLSENEIRLYAELSYGSELSRKNVNVGFLVTRFEEENETDSLLLDFPEHFAVVLVPSKASVEFAGKIIKKRNEYVIYLGDDIEELKYKLSEDYSVPRLKNSIREIVGSFPQAVFFLIDTHSALYKSKVYSLLKEEFRKRRITLIEERDFKSLSGEEANNCLKLFSDILSDMEERENKVFLVSAEDFLNLNSVIIKYRKLGYRFTNPSSLLFKQAKK